MLAENPYWILQAFLFLHEALITPLCHHNPSKPKTAQCNHMKLCCRLWNVDLGFLKSKRILSAPYFIISNGCPPKLISTLNFKVIYYLKTKMCHFITSLVMSHLPYTFSSIRWCGRHEEISTNRENGAHDFTSRNRTDWEITKLGASSERHHTSTSRTGKKSNTFHWFSSTSIATQRLVGASCCSCCMSGYSVLGFQVKYKGISTVVLFLGSKPSPAISECLQKTA